jgi:sugar lactone lactonase YvrE
VLCSYKNGRRFAFLAIALGLGCNPITNTTSGTVIVVVQQSTGLYSPSGVYVANPIQGNVSVAGPSGYTTTLSTTDTLITLATGIYTTTALPIRIPDAIVSVVDTATVSPASLNLGNNGVDTIFVTYGVRPGSGGLWVASGSPTTGTVTEFGNAQLSSSGSPTPVALLSNSALAGATADAVDLTGDLWVATAANAIVEYPRAALVGSTAAPGTILAVASTPVAMAFDPAGDLWVCLSAAGEVVEYSAAQLATLGGGGSPAPSLVLQMSALTAGPGGLAFDTYGNLWIASSGSGSLIELSSTILAGSSGLVTPTVVVQTPATTDAVAPLFDAQGNLWLVTSLNTVAQWSVAQLASLTATTAPALTVTINASGAAGSAAFDNSGSLWIPMGSGEDVIALSAAQLSAGGTQAPSVTIGGVTDPYALAFNAHATYVPVAGSRVAGKLAKKSFR